MCNNYIFPGNISLWNYKGLSFERVRLIMKWMCLPKDIKIRCVSVNRFITDKRLGTAKAGIQSINDSQVGAQ